MNDYIEIQVRKKAHELVLMIFRNRAFPKLENKFVIKMKDAASSIPAELFEAHACYNGNEKIKYFLRARGFLFEVKYYAELLYSMKLITNYNRKNIVFRVNLLDKLLLSMLKGLKIKGTETRNINYYFKTN